MPRAQLDLTSLEVRATPSNSGTSCPPEDPMDNPPPVIPGGGTSSGGDTSTGGTTGKVKGGLGFAVNPPATAVAAQKTTPLLPVTAALLGKAV